MMNIKELKSVQIPVKIGQKVFKICPKCNDRHNGSCKNCAYQCSMQYYCDVKLIVYDDGSFDKRKLQIVPIIVNDRNLVHIIDEWNITYFNNIEEAEQSIKEYEQIVEVTDKRKRVEEFDDWYYNRRIKNELRDE